MIRARVTSALALALGLPLAAGAAETPPNVVVILADDLGYGDLGCYGHPTIRTPHLDRMAAEGMRFTDFYSAAEVCTPSRTALLTGRYPIRSGMCNDRFRVLRTKSTGHLPDDEITLAELLRGRGYATGCFGKWHLGNFTLNPAGAPARHGFDAFVGLPHSNDMDPAGRIPRGASGSPDPQPEWWKAGIYRGVGDAIEEVVRPVDQTTLTPRTVDAAVAFIADQAARPFFLYVPLSFPHVPLFASAEFRGRSPRGLYGDVVEELDANVGRILAALRERGLAERTLVIFSSDNGPWLIMNQQGGSAGLLRDGKGSTWEGGMRVPAIAWWPGTIAPGQVHHGVATMLDILPTVAALAGAPLPADRPIDGVDLRQALVANEPVEREAFYYYRGQQLFAVRSGRWKAHLATQGAYGDPTPVRHDPPQLYDLAVDPGERFDVAAAHPDEAARLVRLARAHEASFQPPPSQLVATTDDPATPAAVKPGQGAAIQRRLPPVAPALDELVAKLDEPARAAWQAVPDRLAALGKRLAALPPGDPQARAEVEVLLKGVHYARDCGEWWEPPHLARATWALDEAEARMAALADGKTPWRTQTGPVALGFRSKLDGSVQPYGIVVPERLDPARPVPVWIWLHGRGERDTDLHFLWQKSRKSGEFFPTDAIVLMPFGRYCNGWKGPGTTDVFEALDALAALRPIDRDRIVLAGFSMGGAGAWGIGARRTDRFCAIHGGAGFVDTARFMGLAATDVPPWEARLWLLTDVPPVVRNLLNLPAIAYSGEVDRQRAASEIMVESLAAEGRELPHVIGAGMAHKYDEPSKARIAAFLAPAVAAGRPRSPDTVHWAGTTLADGGAWWVVPVALAEHCAAARVDAVRDRSAPRADLDVTTANITALRLREVDGPCRIEIDGTVLDGRGDADGVVLVREGLRPDGAWRIGSAAALPAKRKRPGLTGPIDDAFNSRFVVVGPTGPGFHPAVDAFVAAELAHFKARWHDLFRGELPVVAAGDVTPELLATKHLVLFGDPRSNPLVAQVIGGLPLAWSESEVVIAPQSPHARTFAAARHVPVLIQPNPLAPPSAAAPGRYVVLNSGITFREEDDKSNALQNARLPDWAVIDLLTPPDGLAPGRIVAAEFFDEAWQVPVPLR
ncbi:MAG: hypothetical protein FJ309_07085 [Planctomycetes bacterium]|nr:hypothetical protein [Planctomycetota bacterium]